MAVLTRPIHMEANQSKDPLQHFKEQHNRVVHFNKDCSFVRYIGMEDTKERYLDMMQDLECVLTSNRTNYIRLSRLEVYGSQSGSGEYPGIYESFAGIGRDSGAEILYQQPFPFHFNSHEMNLTMKKAFHRVINLFREKPGISESMARNFAVKLLFWADYYLPKIFTAEQKQIIYPKILWTGVIKEQEYLFLYFLFLLGCDVLYVNPSGDIAGLPEIWRSLSVLYDHTRKEDCAIPEYVPVPVKSAPQRMEPASNVTPEVVPAARNTPAPTSIQPTPVVRIPPRSTVHPATAAATSRQPESAGQNRRELDYEELATMSASVVLIYVYDNKQACFKSGSGVMINDKGYILTNFHVANKGAFYGVRIENEEQEYKTDTLIKYHGQNDLALIRIDRPTTPIHLPLTDKLVRGQKVVAIGSPLGLFNTISNGIISGFRDIEGTSNIQFTAPVSHGSSGGALLNLYGNLIGITTGGFDNGQNLNLAVHASEIRHFLRGFLD